MKNKDKIKKMLDIALDLGVEVDRWANIKYLIEDEKFRYKMKKNVVRREVYIESIKEWKLLESALISKISLENWSVRMAAIGIL